MDEQPQDLLGKKREHPDSDKQKAELSPVKNNMVKIDEFLIYENEGEDSEDEKEANETPIVKRNENQKIQNIIANVEQYSYKTNFNKNMVRLCCCCEKDDLQITELL